MKMIRKTRKVLLDNYGESMVEVIVAFTLLSMMLVLFSQGVAWATNAELQASASRDSADAAMLHLQQTLANEESAGESANEESAGESANLKNSSSWAGINRCEYRIDGQVYIVYQPTG